MPDAYSTRTLTAIEKAVQRLIEGPTPEGPKAADAMGRINHIERKLGQYRRGLLSETPDVEGDAYAIETGRRAKRTFNTNGLLAKFTAAGSGRSPLDTIQQLIESGALRLTWQWKKLLAAADDFDVTLSIAKHEIADGDPDADVGEVWTEYTRVVGKKP